MLGATRNPVASKRQWAPACAPVSKVKRLAADNAEKSDQVRFKKNLIRFDPTFLCYPRLPLRFYTASCAWATAP
jgi:hypothetical protein